MAEQKKGGTSNRGFASMDPAKQRAIASKGGSSVPPEKRPFAQNHKLAAEAGRKGGEHSHGGRRSGGEREIRTNVPDRASEHHGGEHHGSEHHKAMSPNKTESVREHS
jgi:uncharacterized protein